MTFRTPPERFKSLAAPQCRTLSVECAYLSAPTFSLLLSLCLRLCFCRIWLTATVCHTSAVRLLSLFISLCLALFSSFPFISLSFSFFLVLSLSLSCSFCLYLFVDFFSFFSLALFAPLLRTLSLSRSLALWLSDSIFGMRRGLIISI